MRGHVYSDFDLRPRYHELLLADARTWTTLGQPAQGSPHGTGEGWEEFTTFWAFLRWELKLQTAENRALIRPEIDKAGGEEGGEHVEEPVAAAKFSGGHMEHRPGNDAKSQAIGDGIGKRDEDQGEKGGDGD